MRNVANHVSHVVFCVRPGEMDEAKQFWGALGIELEEFVRDDFGLRMLYGWNSGIEIITTSGPTGSFVEPMSTYLDAHGPGIQSVVYGVPSLSEAVDRLRESGADAHIYEGSMTGAEPWFARYAHLQEAAVIGRDSLRLALVEKRHREDFECEAGALSHVIYCCSPENIESNRTFLKSALDIDFEEVDTGSADLRVLYSGTSGLEFLAPAKDAEGLIADGLRKDGEGPFLLAFQVPDIEVAVGKAEAHTGRPPITRISYTGLPGWSDRYQVLEEAILEPVCGMRVVLAQIEPAH